jgi:hypothetical protein
MKAYSQAIAQSAETNEPDEPVDYSQNSAELETKQKRQDSDKAEANAEEEMNALISKATKDTAAVTNTNLN